MPKSCAKIASHFVVRRMTMLASMICAMVPIALPQQQITTTPNPAIHGEGTPNHIAKFRSNKSIEDTKILEFSGCMTESPTFDSSEAGILCLHDFTGAGTLLQVLANVPDRTAFLAVNDSATGDPVGVHGLTASADRGIGIRGGAGNPSGAGIGVLGEALSPNGVAGVFNAIGGGNILLGIGFNSFSAFRVDANGNVFANSYNIGGADFAESVAVLGDRRKYGPGDLLVIDPTGERRLAIAHRPYSTLVAGVYSTKPGVVGSTHHMDDPNLAKEVPLAVVGIVPCKVSTENGGIEVGDLLVASSTPGHAMRGTNKDKMLGAVIGKALQSLREGKGVVEVLVTLQ